MLENILMINLPKSKVETFLPALNPDIPLPIQLGANVTLDSFKIEDLTSEMVLAGLLIIFAYDRENKNIDYYRKIFNLLRPDIRKEMTDAAIIKTKNGDFDNAEEILLALEGLNPNDGITKLNLALLMEERVLFYEQADLFDDAAVYDEKALRLYEELILFEPPIPEVFFNAGYFFLKKQNYVKVKSLLSTYLKLENSSSKTAKLRKQKAEHLVNLITTQGLDDELFSSAYDLINIGKEKEACDKIRLFIQKSPKVWNAWFLLGWALRRQNRWEDAKASFLQALKLLNRINDNDPQHFSNIFNEISICCMELKLYSEAEKYLLDALNYDPENIKIISNLGTLALKQNKYDMAEGFFKTVLAINPNDKIAKQVLGLA